MAELEQVSLYDVRFSADLVFGRVEKGIHFGVVGGCTVVGARWELGQDIGDYRIYEALDRVDGLASYTLCPVRFYTVVYKEVQKDCYVYCTGHGVLTIRSSPDRGIWSRTLPCLDDPI